MKPASPFHNTCRVGCPSTSPSAVTQNTIVKLHDETPGVYSPTGDTGRHGLTSMFVLCFIFRCTQLSLLYQLHTLSSWSSVRHQVHCHLRVGAQRVLIGRDRDNDVDEWPCETVESLS